ncbi:hypothetical protein PMAYCL1PPCAC_06249, partial [Pristionchus mayeri]
FFLKITMGQEQSRLKLKYEIYRTQSDEIKKEEALNEEKFGKETEESHALVVASQKEESEKVEHLKEGLHHVEEGLNKRAREISFRWFSNDAIRGYDMHIEVTKGDLHEMCVESMEEFERLKKEQEEVHRRYLEQIDDINEMMVLQEEDFLAAMKKVHEKRVGERKKMHEELVENSRMAHEDKLKMIDACCEKMTNSMGITFFFSIKDAIEKDMTLENIRQTIGRIEESRGKIDDWMVENDFKRRSGGLSPIRSSAEVNLALTYHKSMMDDCSLLLNQLSDASNLMSETAFALQLAPAKRAFGSIHHNTSLLYKEISNLRYNLVKCHTVSLDGIKRGLGDLLHSINNITSIISEATTHFVRDEMKKMEIDDDDGGFVNDTDEVW